jgi:NitT/TauT family transport system substrate-binding protein
MIAASASLPFLFSTKARAQTSPLRIRLADVGSEGSLPFAYAMRTGLFARAGLQIERTKLSSGAAIAAAVAGQAIDIGNSTILSLIVGRSRGVPFTLVAPGSLWLTSSAGGLVVKSTSPLSVPSDFATKTLGTAAVNDINAISVQAWLDQSGVDFQNVKFVEIPQPSALAALDQGRIDGALLSNPSFTVAIASGKTRFVANVYSAIAPRFLFTAWFSTTDWAQRNRVAAERFARVIADASAYVNMHPGEMTDDLVAYTGIERSIALQMKRQSFALSVAATDVQPVIDCAEKYKAIDKGFSAATMINAGVSR